jgi:hypothetical protein
MPIMAKRRKMMESAFCQRAVIFIEFGSMWQNALNTKRSAGDSMYNGSVTLYWYRRLSSQRWIVAVRRAIRTEGR